jgi:chromosome segregation ATPase
MNNKTNKPYQRTPTAKLLHTLYFMILSSAGLGTSAMAADSYDYYNRDYYNRDSYTTGGLKQPKIRWYRYYDSNGQASLSNSITEEQMKYGYEALDRNMQVVKRVPPYSAQQYASQKAQRDASNAKRNADLDLKKTYGSSMAATAKRDQILSDLSSRRSFLSTQLISLQAALSANIAQAANLERQQKAIPVSLKKNLEESRKNVNEAQQNIGAIDARQQQVRTDYDQIIRRLTALEEGN